MKRKVAVPSAQLSLWPEEPPVQAAPIAAIQTEEYAGWNPDEILIRSVAWADGDTSGEALEKLVQITLGGYEHVNGYEHIHRSDGALLRYKVISASVIDGKVVYACQFQEVLFPPRKQWRHEEDEDDE